MTQSVVVLVTGIPGAGKSVLINHAVSSPPWKVLDPDRFRNRLSPQLRRLPIPYPLFVLAVVVAIVRDPQVVVESRGSNAWLRRLIAVCARARGRQAVLILLDAPSREAVAGQRSRGRVAPGPVMRWNATEWRRVLNAASSGALATEGWSKVLVLDRAQASTIDDLGEFLLNPPPVRPQEPPSGDRHAEVRDDDSRE